ncbi:MAG: 2-oxoacid:acceptor oxidoreductase family protein [Candidatus Omnitrophica bacterium]|nr:2-oxoacid:acceptor oxidoreductase family protein [Candidatus Omnitrophota bacterium]
MAKREEVICAGFGGQGILFLGKLIALCAMKENKFTAYMPSYGAEVRGGTAYSMAIISDKPIPSPVITRPDSAIVMNEPSFRKFRDKIKKGGLLVLNSSLVGNCGRPKGIKLIKLPFTEIAFSLGNVKAANMVALGAYIKKTNVVSVKTALKAIDEFIKDKKLVVINKLALLKGASLVK